MKKMYALLVAIVACMGVPVHASINDFEISSYAIEYRLSRDTENRSVLHTTETITAQFPDYDQNHGLVRAIPKSYDGHSTHVTITSVTDGNGAPRTYDISDDDNDNMLVRMADMNVFVHGAQTYRLSYTQRDITKAFADTSADELYWDTNGTDWRVPISDLSVKLTVADDLSQHLTGASACYQGKEGSTDQCALNKQGNTFTTSASRLVPGENVTLAIGFQPGTFAPYEMTLFEKILKWWAMTQAGLAALGAVLAAWIGVRFYRITTRSRELKPIAPEYLPPNYSVITAASQAKSGTVKGSVMAAQLLDLAVRHYIKIYEVSEKKWYKNGDYEIELIKDITSLTPEEKELLSDVYGKTPAVGDRLKLKTLQNNMAYFRRTVDDDKNLKKLARGDYALRAEEASLKKWLRRASLALLIVSLFTVSPILILLTIIVFALSFNSWRLTDAGLALRRHLEGLKMYIKTAEQDRLQLLQSPEGAEKIQSVVKDSDAATQPRQLVKLYERVLPYAVLFGQEKEWSKQLGAYYDQAGTQPDWYAGHATFNAVTFSSGMSGLSQAAGYASSASSSTGGSGGGGASGGGGGGGGGGGA